MMLRSLTLENFRQFHGRQTISFATTEEHNVTVVYGANGAGKTALLNAFTWCLYNATTSGFERPDELVNHRAWAEAASGAELSARVTLEFEHENQIYTVERVTTDRKGAEGARQRTRDAVVTMSFVDEGGREHVRRENPQGAINQILPERLHRFFFFDGERIENLVKPAAYVEIEDAIKTVLGLEVIERSVRHLAEARRILENDLSEVGSEEDKRLNAEINQLREELERKQEERENALKNQSAREGDLELVKQQLAGLEDARDLQEKREELEAALAESEQNIARSRDALARAVNERGYLGFTEGLAQGTLTKFGERRERGEIPADIKLQFVEDLLERGECICGTPLRKGEQPYQRVEAWKAKAGRGDVEAAWNRMPAQARWFVHSRDELYSYLHETRRELASYRENQRRVSERLSEISESLAHVDSEEVRALEARHEQLGREIEEDKRHLWSIEHDSDHINRRIREKEGELEAVQAQNAEAEIAKRRARVAREAREVFEAILALRTDEVRSQLDGRVKELYSQISFKPYVPVLRESFHLDLVRSAGTEEVAVAKSTGENQILSLSFVGAIAERARDRYREARGGDGSEPMLSFQGGIYPIVMDSPFGYLDESYQRQIAIAIPMLAPQVVIFVSKAQGLRAVQDELAPRIGREYVDMYYTPKEGEERETISLRSGEYPYVEPTDEPSEWAVLTEV